ncbi:MAG: DUF4062 domain-containing protein [Planctomycetota bacterium]
MHDVPDPLLVDLASAAAQPSDAEVRAWAAEHRVFISSVIGGMEAERTAVADVVRAFGAQPVMFEDFGGMDSDATLAYLSEVSSSDIYVGILGVKYGRPLPSRFSATHEEFLEAEQQGLRICVWAASLGDLEGHQQSFLDEVRVFYVATTYASPEDLGSQVKRRLQKIAAEELSPWCKLGTTVFRAVEVSEDGANIRIRAQIRDVEVAAALQRMRPGQYAGGLRTAFTWSRGCVPVEVRKVETTTRASRLTEIAVECVVTNQFEQPQFIPVASEGRSADDLTELALRVALLGEQNPLRSLASLATIADPLAPLRALRIPQDSLGSIARLLVTESLVVPGRAERVTAFKLGVAVRDERRLRLSWMPPNQYGNRRAVERSIEGVVRL